MMQNRAFSVLALLASACVPQREAPAEQPEATRTASAPPRAPTMPRFDRRATIVPGPLVSRGKPVKGSSQVRFSRPANATDSDRNTVWTAGHPTAQKPAWLAIEVGRGPSRLLLNWSSSGSFDYEETEYGSPGAYRIDTSADSTDGLDGRWLSVASATAVRTHGGMHSFDFAGERWVRFVVTAAPPSSPNGVQLDTLDLHDISKASNDVWFFMGDSITAFAFGRTAVPGRRFAELVSQRHPGYFPAVIHGGIGGHKSDDGARNVELWVKNNPDARFWAIGYGTNDAAGNATDTSGFRANMQQIITFLTRAHRVPILATIPFAPDGNHANIPQFNVVIDELRREHSLPAGPDLYTWFATHPEELSDGVHPNDKGIASVNRLWADAVSALYRR